MSPQLQIPSSNVLLNPTTYDLGTQAVCFNPGVRYEFDNGYRHASIEVCFACQMLRNELKGNPNQSQFVCFIPGYNRLLKVTKEIFPDDPDIQKSPTNHNHQKDQSCQCLTL